MASVSETMQTALQHHQTGALQEAEALYWQIIRVDPTHADALHLLGVSYHQQDRNEDAVDYIRRAIVEDRSAANYHNSLGVVYRALGNSDKAFKSFRSAIRNDPDFVDAHYNMGTLQKDQGQTPGAITAFRRAIRIRPNHPEAHNNLGIALEKQGHRTEAIASYRKALEFAPNFPEAHHNLGTVLSEIDRVDEALDHYLKAIELKPDYAQAHFNIGNLYRNREQLNKAAVGYRSALEIDTDYLDAHVNLGIVLKDMGRLDEAIASNNRALEIDPESVEAHINRSFVRRMKGDFALGWAEFDWRFKEEDIPDRFAGPVWCGESLENKTILVSAEQGIGDEIMFVSSIPDVIKQASECIVECDARLMPIITRSFPGIQCIERLDQCDSGERPNIPNYDVHIAAGSLLQFVRPTLDTFPVHSGYLVADTSSTHKWRSRLEELGKGVKVGISWRGGRRVQSKRRRTTGPELWSPILNVPNAVFVNLQYGKCADELEAFRLQTGTVVHNWDEIDPLENMESFAALIAALDLVVSIDNSTVHLAGALGVPVWTLLPFVPDWRWQMDREDTFWYPSMRLFRQPEAGDWESVFSAVGSALQTRTAEKSAGKIPQHDNKANGQNDTGQNDTGHSDNGHSDNGQSDNGQISETGDDEWLVDNFYLRLDANKPFFPETRREFHLSRYHFAQQFCEQKRVLDAACGTGYGSALLGEKAASVHGVDINDRTIEYAQRTYGGKHVAFTKSNVEMTPFEDDSFDVVVSFETLEHTISPRSAMLEMVRVLHEDGTALFSIPNNWGLTPYHFTDFNLTMLKELTEHCFEEQEFFYNNSGEKMDTSLQGIGSMEGIDPKRAECILAVCRKPRKQHIVEDRLGNLFDEIYQNAFARHNELLDFRKKSFAAFPDEPQPGESPSMVTAGAVLRLEGDNFGSASGQVVLRMAADICKWSAGAIEVQIPELRFDSPRPAQLHIVMPDGKVASSATIQLAPRIDPNPA